MYGHALEVLGFGGDEAALPELGPKALGELGVLLGLWVLAQGHVAHGDVVRHHGDMGVVEQDAAVGGEGLWPALLLAQGVGGAQLVDQWVGA